MGAGPCRDLSPADVDFIAQSNTHEEAERAQSVKLKRWLKYAAAAAALFPLVALFGIYTMWQGNTIAEQSVKLREQLAQTEAQRRNADTNRRQVVDLVEAIIFNIAAPLAESGPRPQAPTRGSDGSDRFRGKADPFEDLTSPPGAPQDQPDAPSTDRDAAPAQRRNPALAPAEVAVEYTKQLVKANPEDPEIGGSHRQPDRPWPSPASGRWGPA